MSEVSISKSAVLITTGLLLIISLIVYYLPNSGLRAAPDLTLKFTDGRQINLHELRTKPVLITFWATTCETCIKKVPDLKALYEKFSPEGFELIAIAMSYDPPNRILAFSKDYDIPYPIALDIDGSVAKVFDDVSLTPTTFLISPDKKIVHRETGSFDVVQIEKLISRMLREQSQIKAVKTS